MTGIVIINFEKSAFSMRFSHLFTIYKFTKIGCEYLDVYIFSRELTTKALNALFISLFIYKNNFILFCQFPRKKKMHKSSLYG